MVDIQSIQKIRGAIAKIGRDVTVVAAAKTRTKEEIDELMRIAPDFVLGENRVQEFRQMYDDAYKWHFIGQLQTNKVKYLVGKVDLIHSLDRIELADEIERRATKSNLVQDCLVEVNMGSEISKGGVAPSVAIEFIKSLSNYSHIRVRGLMSVLPVCEENELRVLYASLEKLYNETKTLKQGNLEVDILSAGMTDDYEIALEYGSNMIRVGRALFGARVYPTTSI